MVDLAGRGTGKQLRARQPNSAPGQADQRSQQLQKRDRYTNVNTWMAGVLAWSAQQLGARQAARIGVADRPQRTARRAAPALGEAGCGLQPGLGTPSYVRPDRVRLDFGGLVAAWRACQLITSQVLTALRRQGSCAPQPCAAATEAVLVTHWKRMV